MQFAHQNLVVHRDIKPSNLFVTSEGIPKLLDFGIAKLLRSEEFLHTVMATAVATAPGRAPMTPAYASPEQVRGDSITTATDVYSLGILLYELLTGRCPYDVSGLSPKTVEQLICEDRPCALRRRWPANSKRRQRRFVRASRKPHPANSANCTVPCAATSTTSSSWPCARNRNGATLPPNIWGKTWDASSLACRWRRTATRCRTVFGKFVRRHKTAVASTCTVFITLVGLVVGLMVQKKEILEQRNTAQFSSDFLVNLFTSADPWTTDSPDLSVRELLDRGARNITARRDDPPAVRANLLTTMGHLKAAEAEAREALEINRTLLVPEHSETAYALDALGLATLNQGDLDTAESCFTEALQIYRKAFGEHHPRTAEAQASLAWVAYRRENDKAAEELFRRAPESYQPVPGQETRKVRLLYNNLGAILRKQGDLEGALSMYQKALAIARRATAPNKKDLGLLLNNLGHLHSDLGQYQEAESLVREAITIFEAELPPITHGSESPAASSPTPSASNSASPRQTPC